MKAMKFIAILVSLLGLVNVAQAATFGKPYQPQGHGVQYASSDSQMPTLPMSSTGSAMMQSGSALPMAAVSGTTTTDEISSGPRRIGGSGSGTGGNEAEETTDPYEDPIGDAMLPMLLCAAVFCGAIAIRRKRSAIKGEG